MAEDGQQHPLSVYFWIWGLLFVVSFFSYMVDYMQFQGALRWSLILIFMFVKAGFIIAIFMHMKWERLSLKLAILGPPVAILVLIWLMSYEGLYIEETRVEYYGESTMEPQTPAHH
ncbi:MAG: cytochrome C oxidase subunit IV family protein [Gammaproteobacteria bacterium]|nr:cytochrome C oxidase subunit IV family protein [Gammaproteobacteria bacterium]MBT8111663.1 cytochrome C oxidase subunit IV family protein [Gammaproteobacteria bacterium]NND47776.1 cytochrome C oxidase subunit IV [Woeseiaceae bacterium]NNL46361.1 cytochrome C oxidase subunit IV [Woeseiaceae bacterium]